MMLGWPASAVRCRRRGREGSAAPPWRWPCWRSSSGSRSRTGPAARRAHRGDTRLTPADQHDERFW